MVCGVGHWGHIFIFLGSAEFRNMAIPIAQAPWPRSAGGITKDTRVDNIDSPPRKTKNDSVRLLTLEVSADSHLTPVRSSEGKVVLRFAVCKPLVGITLGCRHVADQSIRIIVLGRVRHIGRKVTCLRVVHSVSAKRRASISELFSERVHYFGYSCE